MKPAKAKKPAVRKTADPRKNFESILKKGKHLEGQYVLKLYVTGSTPRSSRAIANIRALCEEYLAGRYDLEIIDLYQQPAEAIAGQIIAAPTLVKKFPAPPRRMVGDLSDRNRVILGLDLRQRIEKTIGIKWVEV